MITVHASSKQGRVGCGIVEGPAVHPSPVFIKFKIHEYILLYHKLLTVSWCVYSFILIFPYMVSSHEGWSNSALLCCYGDTKCSDSFNKLFKHTCRSHHKAISEAHSHRIESLGFLVCLQWWLNKYSSNICNDTARLEDKVVRRCINWRTLYLSSLLIYGMFK